MLRVRSGEAAACEVWQCYVQQLARALAQVINIVDPEFIVIGGGLSNIPEIYDSVPRLWHPSVFSGDIHNRLTRASLGDSAGVFGAAWLW